MYAKIYFGQANIYFGRLKKIFAGTGNKEKEKFWQRNGKTLVRVFEYSAGDMIFVLLEKRMMKDGI